ncbi:MAG: nicotinamide mononucleotide transporter [Chitinophagales bacterium]|nr:nicotinamide mononucleotide transporter [Chitinophagales bacterium]
MIHKNTAILERIKSFTESIYLDLIGVVIVLGGSLYLKFHETIKPLNIFGYVIENYPLGIQSVLGVTMSMMATRLVTRRNNTGNFISLFTTISACMVDYMFGNKAAILTYPVSFFGNFYAYHLWRQHQEIIPKGVDKGFFIYFLYGFSISLVLNYIGFTQFLSQPLLNLPLFITSVIIAGLTFSGQFNTAKRYKENWFTWQIYNIIKFIQNIQMGNIAQLLKYTFYFFNALLGWITWTYIKALKAKERIASK